MTRQQHLDEVALPLWRMHDYLPAAERAALIPAFENFNLADNDNDTPEQQALAACLNLGGQ